MTLGRIGMESISETRSNIKRLGKTLGLICRIAMIVFILLAAFSFVLAGISVLLPDTMSSFKSYFEQNTIFQLLKAAAGLKSMDQRYVSAIGAMVTAIIFAVLALYLGSFRKLLMEMVSSEKPFTQDLARTIRRKSYTLFLMLVYNPVVALLTFLIAMLFSYFVEYGAHIQEKADQTSRIQEEMIVSFAEITENKSGQTGKHVRRVAEYTRILATALGLDRETVENLRLASTMHDIGKLMIPGEILEKPGKLTEEEYRTIKTHTTYGGKLLQNVEGDVIALARTVALEHHERPDGRGYPEGKTEISLPGRIVAVADVYDALTSKRSYKEAWEEDRAYQEIVNGAGTQFDSEVVEAFKNAYGEISRIREMYRD